ncbi:hypothetical protein O7608_03110 [Solwaraspora sp. WMMA2056]|uniref:hypothetical protein n=1 Tax=Solwaraspora sp. WMMA2056 TaxID=3015161 RepID=UPI00259B34A9|nr:hypothetical protein [Solwaraspora sp. WMMA2056]WJK41440.1 hypothetical protein O7608_03110 [Solwaraspora sp. WMMA2056]
MITEMIRDWWLRWRDWHSGRSTASRRLAHLRREQAAIRQRRMERNRGRHWASEPTELVPTLRPLMTYGQSVGYRVLLPSPA